MECDIVDRRLCLEQVKDMKYTDSCKQDMPLVGNMDWHKANDGADDRVSLAVAANDELYTEKNRLDRYLQLDK